jgi:ER-bound oxygenase mpaB/B'/Rubber oxygenase, catalytic domain
MTAPSKGQWDIVELESLRSQGDPEAEDVVAAHFAAEGAGPAELFRRLAFSQSPSDAPDDAVARYMAAIPAAPGWLDPVVLGRAQSWFARVGSHVFCALYAGSLPTAYACHQGVQVLATTARLETDAKRRLNETAQFILDVMRPGGLEPGRAGFQAVRRVRLMHAAVRWLIEHDPRVAWDGAELGRPVNQEDLLMTILTFTEVVFEGFDRTGVDYTPADAHDYLHLWSYVAYLLGVEPRFLPLDRSSAETLMEHVRRMHFGASPAGRELAEALLEQARGLLPWTLKGLPGTAVRWYVGDPTADLIGVPAADWTRAVFGPLASLTRRISAVGAHRRLLSGFSERFGRAMLTAAVDSERGGDRASFSIPEELQAPLGVTGDRRASGLWPFRRAGPG